MRFLGQLSSLRGGSADDWRQRLTASAPLLVSVVLVVALAAQLAVLALRLLAPESGAPPVAPGTQTPPAGTDLPGIVNAHLFGTSAVAATGDAASAPTTSLRLVLAGTLAGADPASGWAIIGETAQAARVYATGTTLPGGARLREVYADRAILERAGRLESLPLPRLSGGAALQVTQPQGAQAFPQVDALPESVRQLIAQDPSAVAEFIRPQPVFAGGQQKGYRVFPGRNRAQFAALGLVPGDLVTAVNGEPLSDPNRGLDTLRGVGSGGPVILTVERNGQVQQVTVDPTSVALQLQDAVASQNAPDPDLTE